HWRCFLCTLGLVFVVRLDTATPPRRSMGDPGSRRSAGRDWLVDGGFRPRRSRRSVSISLGHASHSCLSDLRRLGLDGNTVAGRTRTVAFQGIRPSYPTDDDYSRRRNWAFGAAPDADLSRRFGRRLARRTCIQHLAADRRPSRSEFLASAIRGAFVAEFF